MLRLSLWRIPNFKFSRTFLNTFHFSTAMDPEYETIVEGQASMLYEKSEAVFYNKVQVLNRDLSIQVIRLFAEERNRTRKKSSSVPTPEGIRILDALAATGLRSVRYLKEIPGVESVTINDLLPKATEAALQNVIRNEVSMDRVRICTGDACLLMYQHRDPLMQFDVIDLDPYGSAAPFIDPAVQAIADGGLLCVTCTDMPVLAGNYPETCFSKYGSMSLKTAFHSEMALRILLHTIDSTANKYKKHIVPWISVSVDFYVRIFVRVFNSPVEVKRSCTRRCYIHQSTQCASFYVQPMGVIASKNPNDPNATFTNCSLSTPSVCEETGGRLKIGGPFWSGPIHKLEVVNELLRRLETNEIPHPVPTAPRLTGLLTAISEELPDVVFYYNLNDLCSTIAMKTIPMDEFKAAIINSGYRVSQAHNDCGSIKTNAPNSLIWDILKSFKQRNPVAPSKKKRISPGGELILQKPIKHEVDFTIPECLLVPKKRALRFPPNPEPGWGPKRRAGRPPVKTKISTTSIPAAQEEGGEEGEEGRVGEEGEDEVEEEEETIPPPTEVNEEEVKEEIESSSLDQPSSKRSRREIQK